MKWFRIPKEASLKPKAGSQYSDWKEDLSIEGKNQCVYCAININSYGGIRNFHVEHYRPKSKDKFPELENEFSNLFFACSICNCFKGDDWPNEPSNELDNKAFPDPSKIDYSDFLFYDTQFLVDSNYITGKYIVQKLFLNRPQLILERKSFHLHEVLRIESEKLKEITLQLKVQEDSNPIIDTLITIIETTILLIEGKYINPYMATQIKR
jgi:hypothetical protein